MALTLAQQLRLEIQECDDRRAALVAELRDAEQAEARQRNEEIATQYRRNVPIADIAASFGLRPIYIYELMRGMGVKRTFRKSLPLRDRYRYDRLRRQLPRHQALRRGA